MVLLLIPIYPLFEHKKRELLICNSLIISGATRNRTNDLSGYKSEYCIYQNEEKSLKSHQKFAMFCTNLLLGYFHLQN